jgi:protein-lysine N-methyltransferase EEF2KMT
VSDPSEFQGISDGLVSRLSTLLALPLPSEAVSAQQRSYVTYTLSSLSQDNSHPTIILLEARNLLAATGTTGFRTWEACLHLGAYLCSQSCSIPIANQGILELGAGTGYLSILCAKHLHAAHVTVTDGSDTLVADLATNFYLNGLQDDPVIEAKELKWGQALLAGEQAEWNQGRPVDIVLGADVTYDSEGIRALVATLVDLVEMFPAVKILIAATIRNEETFKNFVKVCGMNSFVVEEIDFPVMPPEDQEGPFYWDGVPIKLCNIKKA